MPIESDPITWPSHAHTFTLDLNSLKDKLQTELNLKHDLYLRLGLSKSNFTLENGKGVQLHFCSTLHDNQMTIQLKCPGDYCIKSSHMAWFSLFVAR